ncbi:hypothetical protein L9F63_016858, partial [Diploptera punctata]
ISFFKLFPTIYNDFTFFLMFITIYFSMIFKYIQFQILLFIFGRCILSQVRVFNY